MRESHMRRKVVQLLKPLHAVSVETGLTCPGTPDVNCVAGWLELKAQNSWPVRPTTVVKLNHDLSQVQRIWLKKRSMAGGKCWVLLSVERDWLLFDGGQAADLIGTLTESEMKERATKWWPRTPTQQELIECLLPPNSPPPSAGASTAAATP